jgi:hypothetical protein
MFIYYNVKPITEFSYLQSYSSVDEILLDLVRIINKNIVNKRSKSVTDMSWFVNRIVRIEKGRSFKAVTKILEKSFLIF